MPRHQGRVHFSGGVDRGLRRAERGGRKGADEPPGVLSDFSGPIQLLGLVRQASKLHSVATHCNLQQPTDQTNGWTNQQTNKPSQTQVKPNQNEIMFGPNRESNQPNEHTDT